MVKLLDNSRYVRRSQRNRLGRSPFKIELNVMNLARANVGLWQCEWCQTKNKVADSSDGERCIACRQFKGSPVWSKVGKEEQSEVIRHEYLSAEFIKIASAIGSETVIPESRYARSALGLALSIEIENLVICFNPVDRESGIWPLIGWVWPEANFVSGLTIYRESNDLRQRCRIERNSNKDRKAVNLSFEKSFDPNAVSLELRLYFGKKDRVESRPRFIKYEMEGTS